MLAASARGLDGTRSMGAVGPLLLYTVRLGGTFERTPCDGPLVQPGRGLLKGCTERDGMRRDYMMTMPDSSAGARPPRPRHVVWALADFFARHCSDRPVDDAVLALLLQRHLPDSEVVEGLAITPAGSTPYAWVRHDGQDYDPARLARRMRGADEGQYQLLADTESPRHGNSRLAAAAEVVKEPELAAFAVPSCPCCRGQSHAHTYDEGCQSPSTFRVLLERAGGRQCSCSPRESRGPYDPTGHRRQRLHWQCGACRESLLARARSRESCCDWRRGCALYRLREALRSGELSFCEGAQQRETRACS